MFSPVSLRSWWYSRRWSGNRVVSTWAAQINKLTQFIFGTLLFERKLETAGQKVIVWPVSCHITEFFETFYFCLFILVILRFQKSGLAKFVSVSWWNIEPFDIWLREFCFFWRPDVLVWSHRDFWNYFKHFFPRWTYFFIIHWHLVVSQFTRPFLLRQTFIWLN